LSLTSMCSNVRGKIAAVTSFVSAVRTVEWSFTSVCSNVRGKTAADSCLVSAVRTVEWSFTSMFSNVRGKIAAVTSFVSAVRTVEWSFTSMRCRTNFAGATYIHVAPAQVSTAAVVVTTGRHFAIV
jgi:hypothetical protein